MISLRFQQQPASSKGVKSDKAVTEDRSTETEKPILKMQIATDRRGVCAFIVSLCFRFSE